MSKKVTTSCDVMRLKDGDIKVDFHANAGKFGTDEMLDGYTLTAKRLLEILQDREDITEEENY